MMIWKIPIHFEEELPGFAIQALEQSVHDGTRGAVPSIKNNPYATGPTELRCDLVDIGIGNIHVALGAVSGRKIAGFEDAVNLLDLLAVNRPRSAHRLESIEFSRIVTA